MKSIGVQVIAGAFLFMTIVTQSEAKSFGYTSLKYRCENILQMNQECITH